MFSLRKEINLMNTQKEKENQLAVRRQTLLASQNVLSKEIDEWSKMSDLDDSPFKVRPPVKVEPIGELSWLNQAKKRSHKPKLRRKKMKYLLGVLVGIATFQLYTSFIN